MEDQSSSRFKVTSEIGIDPDSGLPTFNGRTRNYIVNYCYQNLNYYQMASKPRILEPSSEDDEDYIDLDLF